ncbi:GSCOCG00012110001-RA-CDS, partial [Cotesia congregata]
KLPKEIQLKHAVINIQNKDEFCFLWCVTAALCGSETSNPKRTTSYPHFSSILKYHGIQFPIQLKDIPKFETMNNLKINVYGLESQFVKNNENVISNTVVPLYLSNNYKCEKPVISLLMIETENDIESGNNNNNDINFHTLKSHHSIFHFALIKNLSRLVKSQISKGKHKLWFCERCLCHFKFEKSFEKHKMDCIKFNNVRMRLPENDKGIINFKNHKHKDPVPFVIYADLECTLEYVSDDIDKHVPHSIGYYIHCNYDNSLSKFEFKRSPDCIDWFVKELEVLGRKVDFYLKNPISMKTLSPEQQKYHVETNDCHICGKLIDSISKKCRDHCHFTGEYRGPAHNSCNLNYKQSHMIPIIFHNLSGYDSHFIIKSLVQNIERSMTVLPINKEKYISFTKLIKNTFIHLRFIDSFRFMASSINKLAQNLSDDDKQITRQHYSNPELFQLVIRKGVFPYEYVNSVMKLNDTELP